MVVLVVAGLLSGCAPPPGGTVSPMPSATPTFVEAPSPTAAPPPDLLPRPRVVRVDDLDPCTLLSETDRADLGLDGMPLLDVGLSGLWGGETQLCSIRGYEPRAIALGVQLSVTGGVDLFFGSGVRSEVRPTEVQKFPAIIAVPPRSMRDFCNVVVDVAPGQALDIYVADGGRRPPIMQPELCTTAEEVAEVVMRNLLAAR